MKKKMLLYTQIKPTKLWHVYKNRSVSFSALM